MIESSFTIDKRPGCVQFSIEPFDDIPNEVRLQVREACGDGEEYEVDLSLSLDEVEYIAHRLLDHVEYQRKHPNYKTKEL